MFRCKRLFVLVRTNAVFLTAAVFLAAAVFLTVSCSQEAPPAILLNEVVSGGSDWIEIINSGEQAVEITGFGLSDDEKNPYRFTFPEISLEAGKCLVVYANGASTAASTAESTDVSTGSGEAQTGGLLAPFGIRAKGEKITLTDRTGRTLDSAGVPALSEGESYGRPHSDPARWDILSEATPGKPNADYLSPEFRAPGSEALPPLSANLKSGMYAPGTKVTIAGPADAEIRYTLDGSLPDLDSPFWPSALELDRSLVADQALTRVRDITENYSPPFHMEGRAITLRARAFKAGERPSPCLSLHYFVDSKPVDGTFPLLFVTCDPEDLMDYESGIYVLGKVYADWRREHPSGRFQGDTPANYNRRGPGWRIPAAVELWDGNTGFTAQAHMKISGGWSRSSAQKSFQLFFHDQTDDESGLAYELFPSLLARDGSGITVNFFRSVLVRNGGNDWPIALFRDALISELVAPLPIDVPAWRPVNVYLNGEYWGILNMREAYDEGYFTANYGIPAENVKVFEGRQGTEANVRIGDEKDGEWYASLVKEIDSADFTSPEALKRFSDRIDFKNHALYTAIQAWVANGDWPGNNIRYWKTSSEAGDSPLKWLLFDTEFSFNIYDPGHFARNMFFTLTQANGPEWPNPHWSTILFRQFMKNPEYKRLLINASCDISQTVFSPQAVSDQIDAMTTLYGPNMDAHWKRWPWAAGGGRDRWLSNIEVIRAYPQKRTREFTRHLEQYFALQPPVPVTVTVSAGGTVTLNYISLAPGTHALSYYQGYKIDLEALPEAGYTFTGWEGSALSKDTRISVDPAEGLALYAVFKKL